MGFEKSIRVYAVCKTDDRMDIDTDEWYNEHTNEGGVSYGRKMGDSENRRVHETVHGEQTAVGVRISGTAKEGVPGEGRASRGAGETVRNRDSEGRELTPEQSRELRDTAITDAQVNPWQYITSRRILLQTSRCAMAEHFSTQ